MPLSDPSIVLEVAAELTDIVLDALPELTVEQSERVHAAFIKEVERILNKGRS